MMLKVQLVLFLTIALLAGCSEVVVFGHTVREEHASETKTAPVTAAEASASAPKAIAPGIQRVREVTLSLTPQAAGEAAKDSRFNADTLLDAIKSELQSRNLLDVTGSQASSTAEIHIDDYALRPTTNFILFGSSINAGTLNGNLVLRDAHGNELPGRRIEAQARVSIPESGEAENPLRPLYRAFAVEVLNSLTGASVKSDAAADSSTR